MYVYEKIHSVLTKFVCKIQLFNLEDQILQIESRQILFGTCEAFQTCMDSNLHERICLCVQLSLPSGSKGEQHSLKINIEASFTFSETIIFASYARLVFRGKNSTFWYFPLLENIISCHMDSQSKKIHFLLVVSSFEPVLSKKVNMGEFFQLEHGIPHFYFIAFGLGFK